MKPSGIILSLALILFSCKTANIATSNSIKLRYIGEQVISENTKIDSVLVGGLSSIDYANGHYYVISDDKNIPIRFYELDLDYDQNTFKSVKINKQITITSNEKEVDPESLRFDKNDNTFIWTSEGSIRHNVSPGIFKIDQYGESLGAIATQKQFQVSTSKVKGPRQNGTFECLTMAKDPKYIWVGMELPLREDGDAPSLQKGNYPVRISKIDKKTGAVVFQFVYKLGAIPKDSKPAGKFSVNGTPEILALGNKQFLLIERAYASGYEDGGNTVYLYHVDASQATDIKNISALRNADYQAAKKTLVLDFESIRSKLTNGIVDNIEGITFGKPLANGNQTLVFVSDDNFKKFSPQLTQLIVFEVLK